MLLCSHQQKLEGNDVHSSQEVDWTAAGRQYSNLNEMPSFIAQQRQQDSHSSAHKVEVDPSKLQGKQLEAYNIVKCHYFSHQQQRTSLKMIVSGTAGTGKSYLIWCLQKLLGDHILGWGGSVQCAWAHAAFLTEHSRSRRIQRHGRATSPHTPGIFCWSQIHRTG